MTTMDVDRKGVSCFFEDVGLDRGANFFSEK